LRRETKDPKSLCDSSRAQQRFGDSRLFAFRTHVAALRVHLG
jgi:hypothetical protein